MKQTTITLGKGVKISQSTEDGITATAQLPTAETTKKWISPLVYIIRRYYTVVVRSSELKEIVSIQIIPGGYNKALVKIKVNAITTEGQIPIVSEYPFDVYSNVITGEVIENTHNYFMTEIFNACAELSNKIQERLPELLKISNHQQNLFADATDEV